MPTKLFTAEEEKEIVDLYVNKGLTSGEIAKQLKCVGQTILVVLRKHNVKISSRIKPPPVGELIAGRPFVRIEDDEWYPKAKRNLEIWTVMCECGREITKKKSYIMAYDRKGWTLWCDEKSKNHFPIKVGKKYNRLTVRKIEWVSTRDKKGEKKTIPYCICDCECGKKNHRMMCWSLEYKEGQKRISKSCGCLINELQKLRKDKRKGTKEWELYYGCKKRAREQGMPFDLDFEDVVIPEYCPVLGLKIQAGKGHGSLSPTSPTIDKFYPDLGYVKGNIQVISWRANSLKKDGTPQEWEAIAKWCKQEDIRKRLEGKHPDQSTSSSN